MENLSNQVFPFVGYSLRISVKQFIPNSLKNIFSLFNQTLKLYSDPLEVAGKFLSLCKSKSAECGLLDAALKLIPSEYYLSGLSWGFLNQHMSSIDFRGASLNVTSQNSSVKVFFSNMSSNYESNSLEQLFFAGKI